MEEWCPFETNPVVANLIVKADSLAPGLVIVRLTERMHVTLPEGAKDRIDSVLEEGEDRLEFVRTAIEKEIKRRSKSKSSKTTA